MQWHIDRNGIHIHVKSLEQLECVIPEIEHCLKSEPRSLAEKNDQNLEMFVQAMGLLDGSKLSRF